MGSDWYDENFDSHPLTGASVCYRCGALVSEGYANPRDDVGFLSRPTPAEMGAKLKAVEMSLDAAYVDMKERD